MDHYGYSKRTSSTTQLAVVRTLIIYTAFRSCYRLGVCVAGSAITTTLYHHTHIYIATLLHRSSINLVLHFPSLLHVRDSLREIRSAYCAIRQFGISVTRLPRFSLSYHYPIPSTALSSIGCRAVVLILSQPTSAMPLLDLPNELLRDISEYLESERCINAVAQANRRLYYLLDSYLYGYNVQQSGSSALLWAAECGQEATAQKSLKEKANIQATDKDDEAPLLLAVRKEHRQVVKLLVDKGADVNAQGGRSGNALRAASDRGHEAVVKMLLDKSADVNAQGGIYGNALQEALFRGYGAVVRLLLDEGADVNAHGGYFGNAL
jgi:hypothetical protein